MPKAASDSPSPETATAPEMTPKEEARLESFPAEIRDVLKASKAAKKQAKQAAAAAAPRKSMVPELIAPEPKADEPAAADDQPKPKAAREAPAPEKQAEAHEHEEGVIDFGGVESDKEAPAGEAPDAAVAADVTEADLAGVPAEIRKRLLEKNKENAKIRKRAQEAEAKAAELEKAKADYEAKVAALSDEAAALRTVPPGTGNVYHWAKSKEDMVPWYQVARQGIEIISRLNEGEDIDPEITLPNGTKKTLSLKDWNTMQQWQSDAIARAQQLEKHGESAGKAKEIIARINGNEAFKAAHARVLKDTDWEADRPTLAVRAALGELILSGTHTLRPRGETPKTNLEKAAGATSPAPRQPGGAPRTDASTRKEAPPRELARSMPGVARGDDGDFESALSAAKTRAMTGDPKGVEEMLAIKRAKRAAALTA